VPKIKIDKQLYDKIEKCIEIAGYSSSEEFVQHIIEKEVNRLLDADNDPEVLERLKGLGYIS
jgi:metal-responsive CopG/Arc/MetJ family transcriptional regulator